MNRKYKKTDPKYMPQLLRVKFRRKFTCGIPLCSTNKERHGLTVPFLVGGVLDSVRSLQVARKASTDTVD